jgi:HEPN domain-containing protein
MEGEDARTHLTREWLTKADQDLRAVDLALGAKPGLWGIAAFHSQQAAEQCLKAFLAWHDLPFRRTHNLVELLEQCAAIDTTFPSLRAAAVSLSRFAIDPRYPGAVSELSAEVAGDALQQAREVMVCVLSRLPKEIRPGGP